MVRLIENKIPWWQWIPIFRKWRIVALVDAADEIPETIPKKGVILVATQNKVKWIAFDCPCKIGHRIMLSLDKNNCPCWKIENMKKLTIWPSIDYINENASTRCHYIIKNGNINWVKDEGLFQ